MLRKPPLREATRRCRSRSGSGSWRSLEDSRLLPGYESESEGVEAADPMGQRTDEGIGSNDDSPDPDPDPSDLDPSDPSVRSNLASKASTSFTTEANGPPLPPPPPLSFPTISFKGGSIPGGKSMLMASRQSRTAAFKQLWPPRASRPQARRYNAWRQIKEDTLTIYPLDFTVQHTVQHIVQHTVQHYLPHDLTICSDSGLQTTVTIWITTG